MRSVSIFTKISQRLPVTMLSVSIFTKLSQRLPVTMRSVSIFTKPSQRLSVTMSSVSTFTKLSWKVTGSNTFRLYNSYVRLFNLLSFSWHRIYLSVFNSCVFDFKFLCQFLFLNKSIYSILISFFNPFFIVIYKM